MLLNRSNELHRKIMVGLRKLYNYKLFRYGNKIFAVENIEITNNKLTAYVAEYKTNNENVYEKIKLQPPMIADVNISCNKCGNYNLKIVTDTQFYCVDCDELHTYYFNSRVSFWNVRVDESPQY